MDKKDKALLISATLISVFVGVVVLIYILAKRSGKKKLSKKDLKKLVEEDLATWKGLKETDQRGAEILKTYWELIGWNFSVPQIMSTDFQSKYFWSAIYISNLMKRWGAGDRFKYGSRHTDYLCDGIKARTEQDKSRIFWTYKPDEVNVEVGDIVATNRGSGLKYNQICAGGSSHSDLVYSIEKTDTGFEALAIGGNISNSVGVTKIKLDENGKLINPDRYLAVMKNRLV